MATTVRLPIDLRNPRFTSLAGNAFWAEDPLTAWDVGFWKFINDVDGKVYGVVPVPANLAGSPAAAIILPITANATTGVTRLSVARAFVADGASLNPASLTGETAQNVTVPATARLRKDVTFALAAQPAANDFIIVEIFHEGAHADDTLAVKTELWTAFLRVDVA